MHEVYRPWSSDEGYDYWRVFADAESVMEGHGRVYERLEIDGKEGCCAVVRPDGYIGAVVDVDDFQGLRGYFEGVGMLEATPRLLGEAH
jgi:phenol 2-monooxygenase